MRIASTNSIAFHFLYINKYFFSITIHANTGFYKKGKYPLLNKTELIIENILQLISRKPTQKTACAGCLYLKNSYNLSA
jgi:hypothetical protein